MSRLLNQDLMNEVIEKAAKDSDFKTSLISDPKGTLSRYMDADLPDDLNIIVSEESENKLHLVLPSTEEFDVDTSDLLHDEALGGCTWGPNCQSSS